MSDFTSAKPKDSDSVSALQPTAVPATSQNAAFPSTEDDYEDERIKPQNDKKIIESASAHETETVPTLGQLTRSTAQAIQRLYKEKLGHSPRRVTCHLIANKLIVWAEGSLTKAERLLSRIGLGKAKALRESLDSVLRQDLIDTIEQRLKVKVVTLLTDTCQESDCTAIVVLLSEQPAIRVSKHTVQYF
ncbi:MAG: DUF2294 domain-containing protein [Cyanobacteria bacterium J06649_4]